MAAKMASVILVVVVAAAAVASQTAEASTASDYALYKFCRRLNQKMEYAPSSWATPIYAYEAAMKHFKSLSSVLSYRRQELAAAWRAVTYDEPCSRKSLAYVHSIYACQPDTNKSQKHLKADVLKYAQKCMTPEYLERKVRKYTDSKVERVLTDELLAAYRAANPREARVNVMYDECCRPEQAADMLTKVLKGDFPQEVAQLSGGASFKPVEKFLTQHLYKPCVSHVRQADEMMDKIQSASYYTFRKELSGLPQKVLDAFFRFKFCKNLMATRHRDELTGLMAVRF